MKKQKNSELFEGENSSLRKVYDSIIDDSDQKEYETKECMNHGMGRTICEKNTCDGVPFEHTAHCLSCREAIPKDAENSNLQKGKKCVTCPEPNSYECHDCPCKCHFSPEEAQDSKCECGKFPLELKHICYKGKLYPPLDNYCPICRVNKKLPKMNICEECSNNGETLIQVEPSVSPPRTDSEWRGKVLDHEFDGSCCYNDNEGGKGHLECRYPYNPGKKNPTGKQCLRLQEEHFDLSKAIESARREEDEKYSMKMTDFTNQGRQFERDRIKKLIVDEINIAHSENEKTSRLTSLYNKIND